MITHYQSVNVDSSDEHFNNKDNNDVDNVPKTNKDEPSSASEGSNEGQDQAYYC